MLRNRRAPTARILAAAIALAASLNADAATFVYDGRLDDAGRPANGDYDIMLTPWAAAEQGRALAAPITFSSVAVRDGRFRVDFDLAQPDADPAWLELAVRDSGSKAAFSALPGRVKVLSATLIGQCWSVTGDSGSDPNLNFLGTLDAQPLVLRANNIAGLVLLPAVSNVVSIVGGSPSNVIGPNVIGGVIAGGGTSGANNNNRVYDNMSTVSGGQGNAAGTSDISNTVQAFATVGGGLNNQAMNLASTVSGGGQNVANGTFSTIGGGQLNQANSTHSSVGGGSGNLAAAFYATIPGGQQNSASGQASNVGGGQQNSASGPASNVGGGNNNIAIGAYASISGGSTNCAGGDLSWAGGSRAKVRPGAASSTGSCFLVPPTGDTVGDQGTFLWADSQNADFTSSGPNQFLLRASGGVALNTNYMPATADLVVGTRATSGNTDLLMRSGNNPMMLNFAMSPDAAGASLYVAQFDGTTYTNRLILSSTGDLSVSNGAFKPGGGSWSASSDARLKRDVKPLTGALDRLLKLNGVTFQYITPDPLRRPAGTRIGLIAQEVQRVFPDWVATDDEGYLTVGSQGFEALTVEALREMRTEKDVELDALRTENAALRSRLDAIEKTLAHLNARGER